MVLLKYVLQPFPTYLLTSLATPQYIMRAIGNIHRIFLWHKNHPNKKWALVGWGKICKPKALGGLGLRDPGKLNQVMGEKLWWHWLKHPTELWAKIWKRKYSPTTREEQLIGFNDQIRGSNIWNTAWNNRMLI
jgi:hypothetical protein